MILLKVYGEDDESTMRDVFGVTDDGENDVLPNCFKENHVARLFSSPRQVIDGCARFVYIAIDPCAGTDIPENNTSDFAIVSISKPGTTIIAADSIPMVTHYDYEPILKEHIRSIRNDPVFQNSIIVVDIEANGSSEWSHILATVREFGAIVPMNDYKRKEATNTSPAAKKEMVEIAQTVFQEGEISIYNKFKTSSPNPLRLLEEFKNQLLRYERVCKPKTTLGSKNTYFYSGKGKNKTLKDDLSQTLLRVIRTRKIFLESPQYVKHRQ